MKRFFALLLAAVLLCACLVPSMLGEDTQEETPLPEQNAAEETTGPTENIVPEEITEEATEPGEIPEEATEPAEAPKEEQALLLALPAEAVYTVELPDAVSLELSPTAFEMKVDILRLAAGERLRVTASSENDFKLVGGDASLPYKSTGLDGEYTAGTTDKLTVICGDASSLPAGTLTDTLTFTFTILPAESAK